MKSLLTTSTFAFLLLLPTLGTMSWAAEDEDHGEIVQLTSEEIQELGIEIGPAGPGSIEIALEVPGEVRPNANRLAHIVPRFSGIVTEIRTDLGDEVQAGQTLAILQGDESLAPFSVDTLIPGTVIERHVTLGEAVGRSTVAYVVSDLSTVWIELTIFQRDLDRVEVGQTVEIMVGHDSRGAGTISYITPVLVESTRSATARVVLENSRGRWRPGMFVTGRVTIDDRPGALVVPRTALESFEGRAVVFVQTPEGFVPRPVELGRLDRSSAEILGGLSSGERYIRRGGFTIKAELQKDSIGEGHGH
jgi:membrane fusion protein, heavy metal efflux system